MTRQKGNPTAVIVTIENIDGKVIDKFEVHGYSAKAFAVHRAGDLGRNLRRYIDGVFHVANIAE